MLHMCLASNSVDIDNRNASITIECKYKDDAKRRTAIEFKHFDHT